MNRHALAVLSCAPLAVAALAVTGCSNSPALPASTPGSSPSASAASSAGQSPASTPGAASASASAVASPGQAAATHPAVAAAAVPPRLLYPAPGRWTVPGEQMKLAGNGCKPESRYTVMEDSAHSTGLVLAAGQATASGRFLATVTVRGKGEPNASLDVTCNNSAGTTIEPYRMDLTFIPSVGERLTVHRGTRIPLTGSGCRPGSTVQAVAGSRAEGFRVIGQSAARGSGTFSVEATIPALSAGVHDVFAACQWSGANEPAYPAYLQVIFAGSGPA